MAMDGAAAQDLVEAVRNAVLARWQTCAFCTSYDDDGEGVWCGRHVDLSEAIEEAAYDLDPDCEDIDEIVETLLDEEMLACPGCGADWSDGFTEVGERVEDVNQDVDLDVPSLRAAPSDYARMAALRARVPQNPGLVRFRFEGCDFLGPGAVAFLGALARSVERLGGHAVFDWSTVDGAVLANLQQNGFARAFGNTRGPWDGNSVRYREDGRENADAILEYLAAAWLKPAWVKLSQGLLNEIAGTVWEIYANAFEHAKSAAGVFTCGQHFPNMHELHLVIADAGIGIPASVRSYRDLPLTPEAALEWAFAKGNTTRPGSFARGMGLELLRNFVAVNGGRLEILSGGAGVVVTGNDVRFGRLPYEFPGTMVHLAIKCDERYYALASDGK